MRLQCIILKLIYQWALDPTEWPEEADKCIGWYVGGTQADALDLCEELHNAAIKQSAV